MLFSSTTTTTAAIAILVAGLIGMAQGQNDCAMKLIACANYLNSTNPSAECCNAMKEVLATQLPCLCSLYNNPSVLGGIDMNQALKLPQYCNVSSDTSPCRTGAPGPGSSGALPPPASSGGGNGSSGAVRVSWMGMLPLLLLLPLTFLY